VGLPPQQPRHGPRLNWPTPSSPAALRQAALLFAAAGFIGIVNDVVPGSVEWGHPWSAVLDAITIVVGAIAWRLRNRVSLLRPLTYALTLTALALVALNNVAGALPPATLGIWFVLIYVCVGAWFPRGTALLSSPLVVLAYVLPLLFGAPRSHDDLLAAALVVPIGVLSGEVVAANAASLRAAQEAQERLLEELSRETTTDPLTRIGNRRLGEALLESLAPGDALAVLDLDCLKVVNDTFGHRRGDDELRNLGQHLRDNLREHDAVARFGGDEFILVMRKAGAEGLEVIDRLVAEWRRTNPRATLSAGVAIQVAGVVPELTYADADDALYAAKRDGGGKCSLAPVRSTDQVTLPGVHRRVPPSPIRADAS
jgi:diguanylate cyclase (GGDEF)-like protein